MIEHENSNKTASWINGMCYYWIVKCSVHTHVLGKEVDLCSEGLKGNICVPAAVLACRGEAMIGAVYMSPDSSGIKVEAFMHIKRFTIDCTLLDEGTKLYSGPKRIMEVYSSRVPGVDVNVSTIPQGALSDRTSLYTSRSRHSFRGAIEYADTKSLWSGTGASATSTARAESSTCTGASAIVPSRHKHSTASKGSKRHATSGEISMSSGPSSLLTVSNMRLHETSGSTRSGKTSKSKKTNKTEDAYFG